MILHLQKIQYQLKRLFCFGFALLLFMNSSTNVFAVYPPVPEQFTGSANQTFVVTDQNEHAIAAYSNNDIDPKVVETYYFSQNVWTNIPLVGVSGIVSGLAMNASGTALITVMSTSGNLQTQYFNGTSWNIPATDPLDTAITQAGNVAINDSGTGITIWSDASENIKVSFFTGTNWSAPTSVAGGTGTNPQVDINANGNAVAAWQVNPGNNIMVSHFFGGVWSTPVLVETLALLGLNGVQIDDNGNSIVVVIDGIAGGVAKDILASNYISGAFSSQTKLSGTDPFPGASGTETPSLALAPNGTAVVVWSYNQTFVPFFSLNYAQFDGTNWSPAVVVDNNEQQAIPTVTVDSNGNALLFYGEGNSTTPVQFFTAKLPVGGSLGTPLLVRTAPVGFIISGIISASLADDNFNALSWVEGNDADVDIPFGIASVLAAPPTNLVVQSCPDRLGNYRDCNNTLTWTASVDDDVVSYSVDRNGTFIGNVLAINPLTITDSFPCNTTVTYTVTPIDVDGVPGIPASITVN